MARRGILLLLVCAVSTGHADPGAEATQLFREGRELLKADRLEAACDRFARSQALSPKVGTLLNLGDCYERRGKLAAAWAAFSEARGLAVRTKDDREAEASRRVQILEPRLAYITIVIREAVPGLEVRRGDEVVDPAVWNVEVPIDPATYPLTATAPGHLRWTATPTIAVGQHARITIELAVDGATRTATVPPRRLGLGLLAGANSRERGLLGVDVAGVLPLSRGMLRIIGSVIYARFEDTVDLSGGTRGLATVDTVFVNVGFDYVYPLGPQIATAAGLGVGAEIDAEPISTDLAGALQLRASPIIVRIASGRVETGLHLQLAFASSEVTLHVLAGLMWFL